MQSNGALTMNKAGKFEKVSFDQFIMSYDVGFSFLERKTEEEAISALKDRYERLMLPNRATSGSAGYDFHAPFSILLHPGGTITIPTGIRAVIRDGWFLMCVPRSGLGFRYRLRLANTAAIIDSDYALSDNEGHIFIKLVNEGDRTVRINEGDAFVQGIFLPYGITDDDESDGIRNGGFGSTDSAQKN